jgi:hypothetical protein
VYASDGHMFVQLATPAERNWPGAEVLQLSSVHLMTDGVDLDVKRCIYARNFCKPQLPTGAAMNDDLPGDATAGVTQLIDSQRFWRNKHVIVTCGADFMRSVVVRKPRERSAGA